MGGKKIILAFFFLKTLKLFANDLDQEPFFIWLIQNPNPDPHQSEMDPMLGINFNLSHF